MTAGGHRHALPDPFFVLATQNPIEQEGTYPAARGPARPVPVQDLHQLPDARRGAEDLPPHHRRRPAGDHAADRGRADRRAPEAGPPRAGLGLLHRLRDGPGPGDPRARGRRPEVHRRMGLLGRRAPRRAVADPRRQGPRGAGRAAERRASTTSGPWRGRCCGIGSSSTTTPRPPARRATRSSSGSWTTSRSGRGPPMPPSRTYSDPDAIAQIADLDAAVAPAGRGGDQRPAPQPVPRLQHRVRRVPRVHPGRRPPPARLAGLRPVRPPLHQAVRGREQRPRHLRRRRQRVDELPGLARAAQQVRLRRHPGRLPGDAPGPPAGPGRPGPVRRGGRHDPAPERDPGAGHGHVGAARGVHAGPQDRAGRPAPLAHRPDPPPRASW